MPRLSDHEKNRREFSLSIGVSLLPQTPMRVPSASEQEFIIVPSGRFMIAHKHHSILSRR
jgi:hypothetical protein